MGVKGCISISPSPLSPPIKGGGIPSLLVGEGQGEGYLKRKPLSVNPVKTSPALGAAYAFQGIKGAIALFHAAPGCTFLGKVLLTQHLREPVGLVGTDSKEIPTIMGGVDELKNKIMDVHKKFQPSVIGVIGTALSEVRGEDIEKTISNFELQIAKSSTSPVPITWAASATVMLRQ